MEPNTSTSLFDLNVDSESAGFLKETARWAKFLAIVGFIFCGLVLLVAIFAGAFFNTMFKTFGMGEGSGMAALGSYGGMMISVFYSLFALLYFFPCLYTYNFSTKMQTALKNNDQQQLIGSFRNLKSCFKFMGVLTIIILAIYGIIIIFAIAGAAVSR